VYPFKGRRRGDRGGARTKKDVRHARHTSAEVARRALIIFAERLADEVKDATAVSDAS
jgi:hypothetical protein